MAMGDLPDMYALSSRAELRAYISGKSQIAMLQSIMYHFVSIVTTPVILIPQVIVTLVCKVISTNANAFQ